MNLEVIFVIIFFTPFVFFMIYSFFAAKTTKREFEEWVKQSGYNLIDPRKTKHGSRLPVYSGLSQSSFLAGSVIMGFSGQMKQSFNDFSVYLQSETRGNKNRKTYKRTIIEVTIPDTQLHMIVNSKINNDINSGGNLDVFSKDQKFSLEGDFGEFFDVLMPSTTQSEVLTILAPNSMIYILKEMADYDLEINGNKLFIYTYKHLKVSEIESAVTKTDNLLKQLWLRKGDERPEKTTDALVARTATDASITKRVLKRDFKIFGTALIILYVALNFFSDPRIYLVFITVFLAIGVKSIYDWSKALRLKSRYEKIIKDY